MIRPASAMPSPFSLPALLRIELRDTWPRMIAGMPASIQRIVTERMPRIRLPTAFASVSGGAVTAVAVAAGFSFWPHLLQNALPSGLFAPQFEQNMITRVPALLLPFGSDSRFCHSHRIQ